ATLHTDDKRFRLDEVNGVLRRLQARGEAFLERAGVARQLRRYEYGYQGRYEYQSWDIDVPFELADGKLLAVHVERLARAFHAMHERIYGIKDEDDTVEFTTWAVRAIGTNAARPRRRRRPLDPQAGAAAAKSRRQVFIHDLGGMTET